MQACDRHERAAALALHDRVSGIQGGAHHAGSRLVDASKCRRVAPIQKALPAGRALAHEVDVRGGVEGAQLLFGCNAWLEHAHAPIQAARLELAYECRVAVRTEGMAVAEAVASQALAHDHRHAVRRSRCGSDSSSTRRKR